LFFGFGFSMEYSAQSGGKKREHRRSAKVSFRRKGSAGHADEFAKNGGKKSIFKRLFKKDKKSFPATNRKTDTRDYGSGKKIFYRHRTPGRDANENYQTKRNAERSKKRIRGNKSFARKKY